LPDNLVINVRQISQYPARSPVAGSDLMLLQAGGLGGPYYAATASAFITTVGLNPTGPLAWGVNPPADALAPQIMTEGISLPLGFSVLLNAYLAGSAENYWMTGPAGAFNMLNDGTLEWASAASGTAETPVRVGTGWQTSMTMSPTGHLTVLRDTLTVARDPTAALEVATMGYVTAHTVGSWNGRSGAVTLTLADITAAGGAPISGPVFTGNPTAPTAAPGDNSASLATTAFVAAAIAAVSPDVHSFNGRSGVVTFLTADFNAATAVLTDPVPTAPTAATTDASGQLATTQFVANAIAANGVNSFNGRHGVVTLTAADITSAGGAPTASPAFSGTPNAPTAVPGTSTAQLATTAFVAAAVAAATTGVSSWNTRTGAVVLTQADIVNAAGWASPSFTGVPLAPTAATATNNTQIATCAFVHAAITAGAAGVTTFNTRSGAVVLTAADVTSVNGALLAGPAFTGTPTANTAAPGTNTQQLATTAFVAAALAAISTGVTSFNGRTGPVVLQGNDVSAAGGALVASPTFTGVPAAPTATTGTSTTQLATTAFVAAAIAAGVSGVSTWNGRAGAVTMTIADITGVGGAPIASPALTGVPLAPTASPGANNTQLATTAFVAAALTAGYLPLTGGILTRASAVGIADDTLTLSCASGSTTLGINEPAGNATGSSTILFRTAGNRRWQINAGVANTETGGNAGSDFVLYRYSDAGVAIDSPLAITRSSGLASFSSNVNMAGSLTLTAPSPSILLNSSTATAPNPTMIFGTNGVARWDLQTFGNETGGNAGSDFIMQSRNDAGAYLLNPLTIRRSDGAIALGQIASGFIPGGNQLSMICGQGPNGTAIGIQSQITTAAYPLVFYNNSGTSIGSIQLSTTGTIFNTVSDARLKQDITPFSGARAIIGALAVKSFRWRPDDKPAIGVIAQEARDVYPDAISDGRGEPGDETFMPMGVDYSKYVPLLIEALQEAHRRIDELERKVQTLH
jgi:hypothetical protein